MKKVSMKKPQIKKPNINFDKITKSAAFGKVFRFKPLIIIVGIFILIMLALVTWSGGCTAYVYNSEKFTDAVGTWKLDCIYVDTKPITFNPTVLVIERNKSATSTQTITVTPEIENADGTVTAAVTSEEVTTIEIKESKGAMTFTANGAAVEYEFSVDEDAGLLHLYTTIDGHIYHYIYILQN